jgi:hypothetical protein
MLKAAGIEACGDEWVSAGIQHSVKEPLGKGRALVVGEARPPGGG